MVHPGCFQRALVLTGPTGSGKSGLALDLAEQLGAEIVSMDSMTIYRGFDIGTAKPSEADRARVPHHLIDVLDPWESGSVAWWLERAAGAVADIERRGRIALVVGGTPMYLKALLRGLFKGPPAHPRLRKRLEAEAEGEGVTALHSRLASVDPSAATKINPNDLRRIIRALEVWELTGQPISSFQQEWVGDAATNGPEVICLDLPRINLYERINQRVLAMLDAGWLDEARRLRKLPRPPSREASAALGYRELWAHLDGQQPWDQTVLRIQQGTRNFAKRQLTWFRHLPNCHFVTAELTTEHCMSKMNRSARTNPSRERNENGDVAGR
jgi:tRNA dimethylallyltransferase